MIEYEKKIAQQTLNILMKKSWNSISLEQVLKNVRVKKIYIKTKFDLLIPVSKYVDYLLINNTKSIENSSTKDMLFEVIMARFDILNINRKSVLKLFNLIKSQPNLFLFILPSLIETIILILTLAEIEVKGIKGAAKIKVTLVFIFY